MAFKSVKQYNDERFGGLFLLRNDRDYADVVFMYRGVDDVLVADTHYIKSVEYSGYVHCCGRGCPACERGIRVQTKLFIPLYNIQADEIQFFDRSMRFENQLNHDVFSRFPNPSEYVFRITRHGAAGDVNTTYDISAVGRNTYMSYNEIMAKFHATSPDYYSTICKEFTAVELDRMLNSGNDRDYNSEMPSYSVTPRGVTPTERVPEIPQVPEIEIPDPVDDVLEDIEESIDDDVQF